MGHQSSKQSMQFEFDSKGEDLALTKAALQTALQNHDEVRTRNNESKSSHATGEVRQQSLLQELEQARANAAKAEAEKVASDKCAEVAAEQAVVERQRLEENLKQA